MGADDWRQAQLFLKSPVFTMAKESKVKILAEGNAIRTVIIIPNPWTLSFANTNDNTKAFVDNRMKEFLMVVKYGLCERGLNGEKPEALGFDEAMKLLNSCVMLHELAVEEPEIKYQCSCSDFWTSYKCAHSLAMSIRKKGVEVPPIYNITNIGASRKRGRPRTARAGDALVRYGNNDAPWGAVSSHV